MTKKVLSILGVSLVLSQMLHAEWHIVLCGGPSLQKWERLRYVDQRHDRWWANFVRASTIRIDSIRKTHGSEANITWIVFRPGYVTRGREDGKPYIKWITMQAEKRGTKLVWVHSTAETIHAINNHPQRSVATFDYFGHSNPYCFMLDYSNMVMKESKAFLHQNHVKKIRASIFKPTALCRSYGCHTATSMSAYFKRHTGVPLIGTKGKSDYTVISEGKLPVGAWRKWSETFD